MDLNRNLIDDGTIEIEKSFTMNSLTTTKLLVLSILNLFQLYFG